MGPIWEIHIDGAFNTRGVGADIILSNPNGEKLRYAIHYNFHASNNDTEYEALIMGLELERKLEAKNLRIYYDSQLIVNLDKGNYMAKEPRRAQSSTYFLGSRSSRSWEEMRRLTHSLTSGSASMRNGWELSQSSHYIDHPSNETNSE